MTMIAQLLAGGAFVVALILLLLADAAYMAWRSYR
jgi:hypothetical protein